MELGMEAGAEIEQTLAFARQTTERQLATYRVWMFGFLCLVSYPISYFNGDSRSLEGLRSPAVLTLLAVYALLLRARVLRREVTDRVVWLSIVGDLLGVATAFWVAVPSEQSRFIETHVAAPTFICILAVNLLRNDGRAAILAGGVTALVLPVVLFRQEPFNFLPIALALGCIPMSIIGVAAARQSRRTLDTFARLRLLRRYLAPQAVARVLRDNPEAAFSLGGRLLTVTLLSADLRDFTALAEKLTPDEVVRQLNAYHGAMLKVVRRHGGMLDKFIGDGTLVVFGLPEEEGAAGPSDQGAAAAVACAREMLWTLAVHNAERAKLQHAPLRMGIGVHTGPVVAGNIGAAGERLEFTVIGDAVNTASRLEGLTKQAAKALLISAATVQRLTTVEDLSELAPMHVKGKDLPLRVFGESASADATRTA